MFFQNGDENLLIGLFFMIDALAGKVLLATMVIKKVHHELSFDTVLV